LNPLSQILLETEQSANPLSQFDNSQKVGTLGSIYVSHFNKLSYVHQPEVSSRHVLVDN
jgi:hypothetical protein